MPDKTTARRHRLAHEERSDPVVPPARIPSISQLTRRILLDRTLALGSEIELRRARSGMALLATIGSTAPFVGLFGTVWGIMRSFTALGSVQHASLSMVAPGIAEALIATAMGLFAAIPAVIAYNRYAEQVNRLASAYENFAEEFATILQRQSQQTSGRRSDDSEKGAS